MLSANFTLLDPVLTQNYCGTIGVTYCPDQQTPSAFNGTWVGPLAPAGTNLPVAPKFKGNVVARYTYNEMPDWTPYGQAAFVYQTQTSPVLLQNEAQIYGMQPAYGILDLTAGITHNAMQVEAFIFNATDKRAQLSRFTETNPLNDNQVYVLPNQPRTYGLKLSMRF